MSEIDKKHIQDARNKFEKQSKQTLKYFKISMWVLGIFISLSIGVLFNWRLALPFTDKLYYEDRMEPNELGDFLAGTVGILIAVLNAFLLYRTIKMQADTNLFQADQFKAALDEGNKQFSESLKSRNIDTIFKLIEFHKNFITTSNDYKKLKSDVHTNIKFYGNQLNQPKQDASWAKYHPILIYESKREVLNQLVEFTDNVITTIENSFSVNELSEKNKYHQIYFTSLDNDEKFLIGMVYANKTIGSGIEKTISFDYKSSYMSDSSYRNIELDGLLPHVNIALIDKDGPLKDYMFRLNAGDIENYFKSSQYSILIEQTKYIDLEQKLEWTGLFVHITSNRTNKRIHTSAKHSVMLSFGKNEISEIISAEIQNYYFASVLNIEQHLEITVLLECKTESGRVYNLSLKEFRIFVE